MFVLVDDFVHLVSWVNFCDFDFPDCDLKDFDYTFLWGRCYASWLLGPNFDVFIQTEVNAVVSTWTTSFTTSRIVSVFVNGITKLLFILLRLSLFNGDCLAWFIKIYFVALHEIMQLAYFNRLILCEVRELFRTASLAIPITLRPRINYSFFFPSPNTTALICISMR